MVVVMGIAEKPGGGVISLLLVMSEKKEDLDGDRERGFDCLTFALVLSKAHRERLADLEVSVVGSGINVAVWMCPRKGRGRWESMGGWVAVEVARVMEWVDVEDDECGGCGLKKNIIIMGIEDDEV
ncbi:hypothetical protein Tco_0492877 [Tanacetum coccineum]